MKERLANLVTFVTSDRKRMGVVFVCFLLAVGFLVTLVLYFSNTSKKETTSSLPPELGSPGVRYQSAGKKSVPTTLTLEGKGDKKSFKVNDTITLLVVGDTGGQIIRGYDAIFRYDDSMVSYIKSTNLDKGFDYQQRKRGDWILISGAQKLDKPEKIVLKKRNLVEIQFKALKAGRANFPLSFVEGRLSDSNIINDTSEDILTNVTGITIQITK